MWFKVVEKSGKAFALNLDNLSWIDETVEQDPRVDEPKMLNVLFWKEVGLAQNDRSRKAVPDDDTLKRYREWLENLGKEPVAEKRKLTVDKIDSNTKRIWGPEGGFEFLERGKHWEVSYFGDCGWELRGEFDKYPQVDCHVDLLYLRAVKLLN